jgi:hypothetical protein
MNSAKPALGPAGPRQEDGRPARPLQDEQKIGPRPLGRRLLPQVPAPRMRKTAAPR